MYNVHKHEVHICRFFTPVKFYLLNMITGLPIFSFRTCKDRVLARCKSTSFNSFPFCLGGSIPRTTVHSSILHHIDKGKFVTYTGPCSWIEHNFAFLVVSWPLIQLLCQRSIPKIFCLLLMLSSCWIRSSFVRWFCCKDIACSHIQAPVKPL